MAEVGAMDPGLPGDPLWPAYAAEVYAQDNASEDCLYVDIWTPTFERDQKLPVYVYYHGGANTASSGHFRLENAANLAREENIIVVRPTYRMGALGCVHFGLVSDRFPEAINLGLQDQIAALKWVYDNIEAFGGDRNNITVGGESAGATAVSHLLTYPGT
jgi:para-nitrobenzyl esterase